jgi:hypothetical protein
MHYSRWQRYGTVYDWRDEFIRDNPPCNGVGLIPLTKGKCAIVDEKWYDYLMQWKWCTAIGGYAVRKKPGTRQFIHMHRVVNNTPDGKDTDHINGNRLDNRAANLRDADRSENNGNGARKGGASGFKGVSKNGKRWLAAIGHDYKTIYLGTYATPQEAARAYNAKALELFGVYAKLNTVT